MSFYKEMTMFGLRKKVKVAESSVPREQTEFHFSRSIQVAMDFYYKAIHQQLPEDQQKEIELNSEMECAVHSIAADSISMDRATNERERKVWLYPSKYSQPYMVIALRQALDEGAPWRVVSFEYPRKGHGMWTAVFEIHYDFGLRTRSYNSSSCY